MAFGTARIKEVLEGAGIPWAVAAGAAVYSYTANRPPTDLDLLVRPRDLDRVGQLLGVPSKMGTASWGESTKVNADPVEIVGRLVVRLDGGSYQYEMDDEMLDHVRTTLFEGTEVPVLAPEDVIALKAVLQRGPEQGKHDLEDIAALAAKVAVDVGYLGWRLRRMGAEERAESVLRRFGWVAAT